MLGYITRRLLFMIPTLFGITFLVFMLLALSPGGIGASLRSAGGNVDADAKASLQMLYLEDRYGLDDPAVVQYFRWLSRISPLKFGERSLRNYANDLETPPREVKPLPIEPSYFGDALVVSPNLKAEAEARHETVANDANPARIEAVKSIIARSKNREEDGLAVGLLPTGIPEYKEANKGYLRARAQYLFATRAIGSAISAYATEDTARLIDARAAELVVQGKTPEEARRIASGDVRSPFNAAVGQSNVIDYELVRTLKPDTTLGAWQAVLDAMSDTVAKRAEAEAALARVRRAFDLGPYPVAGVGVGNLVSLDWPDFGKSFSIGRPVIDLISEALPVTLLINLLAIPLIYLVAVPLGIQAAARHDSFFDKFSGSIFVMLWSVPVVWAGVLAIGFLADKEYLGLFPASGLHSNGANEMAFMPTYVDGAWQAGYLLDMLWHIVLPVMCLVYGGFAVLAKQTRAAMLDNFTMDFVRTARSKGVSDHDVKWYHVFRNSLLPIITIFVLVFPAMLAGSVVVERIFSIPGMGSLILAAIFNMDRDVILANVFMIAVVNLFALLLADILYAVADPRVTYD